MIRGADIAVLALLAILAAGAAMLQADEPRMARHDAAIRQVISAQIEAFRADDNDRAFGFAAPDIQAQFGAADGFMAMVRAHYRPVYRAQSVDFSGPTRAIQETPEMRIQHVHLVDDRGAGHQARYVMQKQPDGSWKIAGCHLLQSALIDI